MQTFFKDGMVKDAETERSEAIFRNCVHCGLCTGTCPTYQLLGDELGAGDSGSQVERKLRAAEAALEARTAEATPAAKLKNI